MKGDFTRSTFHKEKHYNNVNMQQGRVQVDADWNEQNDIKVHHEKTFLRDILGKHGTLFENNGFRISANSSFSWADLDGYDKASLETFLKNNFGLKWIRENVTVKVQGDTATISAPVGTHYATITRGSDKSTLVIDGQEVYEFLMSSDKSTLYTEGYVVGKGTYYVDGILCENESDIEVSRQPDLQMQMQIEFFMLEWDTAATKGKKALIDFLCAKYPEVLPLAIAGNLDVIAADSVVTIKKSDSGTVIGTLTLNGQKATLAVGTQTIDLAAKKNNDDKLDIYFIMQNPSLPNKPSDDTYYVAYIDVYDQHVTYLEDSYLLESALGGVDTATRSKTAWQVKLLAIAKSENPSICDAWDETRLAPISTGKMKARVEPSPKPKDNCSLYETGGYRGLENQLYRVEVHDPGSLAQATFKWSRENGSVVSKITGFDPNSNDIVIARRGRDDNLDFGLNDWIEITDDLHERFGIPGTIAQIKTIENKTIVYYPEKVRGYALTKDNFLINPRVRRWESNSKGALISLAGVDYIDLEDGIQIEFDAGNDGRYNTGDYWLIPARTKAGEIEWPRAGDTPSDEPLSMPVSGVEHHYAPLALLLQKPDGKFEVKSDARHVFSSLADLVGIQYAGGDGQEALPSNTLPEPLRVAVTLGGMSIATTFAKLAIISFVIPEGEGDRSGSLSGNGRIGPSVEVPTNAEGIAECTWTVGTDIKKKQIVRAELLDACGKKIGLPPIYFTAALPTAFFYVKGDGREVEPGGVVTVAAGLKVGTSSSVSGFKAKFTAKNGSVATDPSGFVAFNGLGIAETFWTLDSIEHGEQTAFAELYFADGTLANLPPVYFDATVLKERSAANTAANTGVLELQIPRKANYPLTFGPFKHYLQNLQIPPAILLGLIYRDKSTIVYTEDFAAFKQMGVHFKPVEITPNDFKVQIWIIGDFLPLVPVRWWAIPAEEKEPQRGRPITGTKDAAIFFDKTTGYNIGEKAVLTVQDPNLSIVDNPSGNVIAILSAEEAAEDAKVTLTETAEQVNVYKKEMVIGRGVVIVDNKQFKMPQLIQSKTLYAKYKYDGDRKIVNTHTAINDTT